MNFWLHCYLKKLQLPKTYGLALEFQGYEKEEHINTLCKGRAWLPFQNNNILVKFKLQFLPISVWSHCSKVIVTNNQGIQFHQAKVKHMLFCQPALPISIFLVSSLLSQIVDQYCPNIFLPQPIFVKALLSLKRNNNKTKSFIVSYRGRHNKATKIWQTSKSQKFCYVYVIEGATILSDKTHMVLQTNIAQKGQFSFGLRPTGQEGHADDAVKGAWKPMYLIQYCYKYS